MNWYKAAQSKSLEELLQLLESNPGVDRSTLAWLKALEGREKGSAIKELLKNPRASIGEMQSLFPIVVPLTGEQEDLVKTYPLIGTWMRGVMERLSGKKRETAFNILREKAAGIRDWIHITEKNIQARTLENAVEETEKWHSESISLEKGEYLPTKPEDIIISYQNKYTWQRISRGTDVKIEGQKTQTCVGNYCNDVDEGKIDVYSLRDENNSPLVTGGFKHKGAVVVQMKGPANKNPSETYKGYISDILKKLGTIYNDGERYLSNYNLKNFRDLNADDIEKSTLLQKIVNNQIAREGDPPGFAESWAKRKLESGAAPKTWEAGITSHITLKGRVGPWAQAWADAKLDSGAASKELEAAIISHIRLGKGFGPWAQDWAKRKLESGTAPKELEAAILSHIVKSGFPPYFIKDWAKKVLDSGSAPKAWEEAITSYITQYGQPPFWAQEWAKKVLDSGTAPKTWEAAIINSITEYRHPTPWEYGWAKKILDSGAVPKEWEAGISSNIEVYGHPPDWARDWAKRILESGTAPKTWEAGITSYITRSGEPPNWAQDWYYKNENYKR